MPSSVTLIILQITLVVCIVIGFFWLGVVLSRYVRHHMRHERGDEMLETAPGIVHEVIVVIMVLFGVGVALTILGIDVGFLFFGLTLGVGYAAKNTIRNLMSGIMIMTNKQFRMGDLIEFMYNGEYTYFGRIEEITLRYTVMRKLDYRRTIIPNYFLTSYPIITYSSEPTVRLETRCSVPLRTDITSCKKQMLTAINALDFIVEKEFTLVLVEDIGVTGINILIYFYIDPKAGRLRFRAVSDVSHAIADIFTTHGISFTLPHTVITVDPLHPREQEVIQKAAEQVYG